MQTAKLPGGQPSLDKTVFIHRYRRTHNLGDAIQTIAMERLLPDWRYVWRDDGICDAGGIYLANGWLGSNRPPVDNPNTLFAGVFVANNDANYDWMKVSRFFEIGARDPATVMRCAERGIRTILLGCATSTFDPYLGPRNGIYAIDASYPTATHLTHCIGDLSWNEQRELALTMLGVYQTAELVVTSRLHAALPCLAFGTPVMVKDPIGLRNVQSLHRFSILDAMGLEYEKPQILDISIWRERFLSFLVRNLGMNLNVKRTIAELSRRSPPLDKRE